MSDPFELEPLPEALRTLVDAEQQRPELDAEAQARLPSRIHQALAAAQITWPGQAPDTGSAPSDAASSAPVPGAAQPVATGLAAVAKTKIAALVVAGAVAGGAGGAALHAQLGAAPPPPPIVIVMPPAAPPAQSPEPVIAPPVRGEPAPVPTPKAVPATKAPTSRPVQSTRLEPPAASSDSSLLAERSLVEQARSALARGLVSEALAALKQLAARFAGGRLAEERDAVLVHALAAAGRQAEADEKAKAVLTRYPESLFRPLVDAAVAAPEK